MHFIGSENSEEHIEHSVIVIKILIEHGALIYIYRSSEESSDPNDKSPRRISRLTRGHSSEFTQSSRSDELSTTFNTHL